MPERSPKKQILEQLARIGKALSSPNRLELLEFLAQGEKGVDALAHVSGLSVANTSQHLQHLRQAGLVISRKDGQNVFYRIQDDTAIDLIGLIRKVAEKNLAEVDLIVNSLFKTRDNLEPVTAENLIEMSESGQVTILDVRPPDEYEAGHIDGAINVPMRQLEEFIANLKAGDGEIVAYCRGPYCLMSFDAVSKLREKGFIAKRLETGYPEWKRAGLPIEKK